jgi:hypothetical protein
VVSIALSSLLLSLAKMATSQKVKTLTIRHGDFNK